MKKIILVLVSCFVVTSGWSQKVNIIKKPAPPDKDARAFVEIVKF